MVSLSVVDAQTNCIHGDDVAKLLRCTKAKETRKQGGDLRMVSTGCYDARMRLRCIHTLSTFSSSKARTAFVLGPTQSHGIECAET